MIDLVFVQMFLDNTFEKNRFPRYDNLEFYFDCYRGNLTEENIFSRQKGSSLLILPLLNAINRNSFRKSNIVIKLFYSRKEKKTNGYLFHPHTSVLSNDKKSFGVECR